MYIFTLKEFQRQSCERVVTDLKISKIEMCHVNRTESPFYLNLRL